MKIKKTFLVLGIVFLATIALINTTSAQETDNNPNLNSIGGNEWQPAKNITGVDCFDYYKFQSVQVSVGVEKDDYKEGEQIIFRGNLLNENNYPVVDGNVFVRISKTNKDDIANGNNIVDEIIALKDIALDSKESKDVEFSWNIPSNIIAGDYQADFFFSVGKKFNLGGLPFSNEIIIGMSSFKISSKNETGILFNRAETKVNGEKYYHIGNWPVIEKDSKVSITQPIKNTTDKNKKVKISYDLYFWDSLNEDDKISSKTEEVNIPANSEKNLEYIISKMNQTVYYLKITAETEDGEKAIVNIRVTSEQNRPRLNYPAITKFPIKKGEEFTLFSCFHNTAYNTDKGKIIVVLTDRNGKEVGKFEYNGIISSQMMADKKDLVAKKDYDYLKLSAKVYDNSNKEVDHYETTYDCKMFNSCKKDELKVDQKNETSQKSLTFKLKNIFIALIAIFSIIFVAVVAVILVKKNKNKDNI